MWVMDQWKLLEWPVILQWPRCNNKCHKTGKDWFELVCLAVALLEEQRGQIAISNLSYIDIGDDGKEIVHANKIRKHAL